MSTKELRNQVTNTKQKIAPPSEKGHNGVTQPSNKENIGEAPPTDKEHSGVTQPSNKEKQRSCTSN